MCAGQFDVENLSTRSAECIETNSSLLQANGFQPLLSAQCDHTAERSTCQAILRAMPIIHALRRQYGDRHRACLVHVRWHGYGKTFGSAQKEALLKMIDFKIRSSLRLFSRSSIRARDLLEKKETPLTHIKDTTDRRHFRQIHRLLCQTSFCVLRGPSVKPCAGAQLTLSCKNTRAPAQKGTSTRKENCGEAAGAAQCAAFTHLLPWRLCHLPLVRWPHHCRPPEGAPSVRRLVFFGGHDRGAIKLFGKNFPKSAR